MLNGLPDDQPKSLPVEKFDGIIGIIQDLKKRSNETFQDQRYRDQSAADPVADGGRGRLYFSPLINVCCAIIFVVMGVITIEIPQRVNKKYRIVSESSAKEVLAKVDDIIKKQNKIDDDDILGLWSDRNESAGEIARNLRKKSNDRNLKNA